MTDQTPHEKELHKQVVQIRHELEHNLKALKASEQQFRAIADNAVDAIISIDSNSKITFWNKAAEKFFGYKAEEIINKELTIIMPERYRPAHKKGVARFVRTGKTRYLGKTIALEGLRKNGTEFPLELSVSSWKIDDELYFTAIIRDDTERKKIEEALKTSEERFRRLSEAAFEGIVIHEQGKIIEMNLTLAHMFGYEPKELIGKIGFPLLTPESQKEVQKRIATGSEEPYQVVGIRKDGTTFPIEIHAKTTQWKGRTVRVGAISNITERKKIEQKLKDSEKRYRQLVELSPDGVAIHSEGKLIYANPAALSIVGATKLDQLLGKSVLEFVHPDFREIVKKRFQEMALGQVAPVIEEKFLRLNGTPIDVEAAAAPIIFQEKPAIQVFFRDITERKQIQNELKKAKDVSDHISEVLQESLIRPVPKIPKLKIATALESAYEAQKIGGDFYDVFELGNNLVAVLIGDVAGKGVEAAGLTETVRSSVRTLAYIEPSPSFVFSKTNQSIMRQTPPGMFVTAAFFIINTNTGRVRFSRAGHPPAILCNGVECRVIEVPLGNPLGTFTDVYEESYLKLKEKQTIILYTDGLTEAKRGPELFGEVGVLATLAKIKDKTPRKIVDGLVKAAAEFAQGKLQDDIALVAIRY